MAASRTNDGLFNEASCRQCHNFLARIIETFYLHERSRLGNTCGALGTAANTLLDPLLESFDSYPIGSAIVATSFSTATVP
jgi:hypothetical protein